VERWKRSRNFVPAYGIVAYPETPGRPSLAEQLAASLEQQLGSEPGTACFTRFQVTDKNKGIISASVDGRPVVVKLPFNEAIGARAARNHRFIVEARQHEALQTYLPRALGTGEILGIRYYAEERVAGHPLLDELDANNGTRWFDAATGFLEAVNAGLQQRMPEALTAEVFQHQVSAPLERLARVVDATLVERIDSYLRRSLEGLSVRLGVVHGDFCASNVFVQSGSIVGVIDWDDSDLMGIPALDALNFVDSLYRGSNRHSSAAQVISRLARWDGLAGGEKAFLEKSYRRCGIEPRYHYSLVCLYWLRHVADQLDGDMIYNKTAIEERITMTFEELLHNGHDG
jgi:aminoglycoside phosphotransferase (APT) family kinase protein